MRTRTSPAPETTRRLRRPSFGLPFDHEPEFVGNSSFRVIMDGSETQYVPVRLSRRYFLVCPLLAIRPKREVLIHVFLLIESPSARLSGSTI